MNVFSYAIGYVSCLVSIILGSSVAVIVELIWKKAIALKQARLQNDEEGKDL